MHLSFRPAPNGQSTTRLLLYFNGWAMNAAAVDHLITEENQDVLIVEDYREDAFAFDFSPYKEVVLLAWSMGVWAAEHLYNKGILPPLTQAVAIAGTPQQRNNEYGIPEELFDATLEHLNEENRARFNRRMCGGKRLRHLFEALQQRPTEEIREELEKVRWHTLNPQVPSKERLLPWTLVHIPLKDKIIPAHNQIAYWTMRHVPIIKHTNADHYLFDQVQKWNELLE